MSRSGLLLATASLLFAAFLAGAILWLAGFDPLRALGALVAGAAGDSGRVGVTLLRASPLVLTGLGVALAFRAGLWNLGAEGQLLAGALVAAWLGSQRELPLGFLLPVAGAALGGALWGGIAGALRARLDVPEVISTILLNFVAVELRSWLVLGPMREAAQQYPQTDLVTASARLPALGILPGAMVGAAVLALLLHLLFERTRAGLRLRAAGLNPLAARAQGVRVRHMAFFALAGSGALAGLAGAAEILGSIGRVYEGYSPGHGFAAIAVALLARLQPLAVLPSALLFGALQAGAERMELSTGVPSALSLVVQAAVILGSAVAGSLRREERP